ncbi:hypothetical protein BELL_0065g00200 [Botrytis elliptica]|uniref:Uncharacterized protein n=1 Tax=Botrytis elliptica TaxID=278938 RepID=A0A4Z1K4Q7_9HELO|nr:hypothetical protein BELL_0065g00200 [Botrytis elliptica]
MAKYLGVDFPETMNRAEGKAAERTPKNTSTAPRNPCLPRNTMLRSSSIISGPAAQPQTFHSGVIAKGQTSRFVEEISSDEDLKCLVKSMGAAKTFDEMPLPPGKVRSATACEEQTKAEEAECWFRRCGLM